MNIVIIDYGMGNLGSIANMIKKIGENSIISSEIKDIENADKIILPGVGAFDNGMQNLSKFNFIDLIKEKALINKTPVLGICLGMQLLTNSSEEGKKKGLSLIDAETIRFNFDKLEKTLKIPNMGWNDVHITQENELFSDLEKEARFYFVHSYYVKCHNNDNIIGESNYGIKFVSAIRNNNIYGVQFHPEKSHKYGMKLLKNFLSI